MKPITYKECIESSSQRRDQLIEAMLNHTNRVLKTQSKGFPWIVGYGEFVAHTSETYRKIALREVAAVFREAGWEATPGTSHYSLLFDEAELVD